MPKTHSNSLLTALIVGLFVFFSLTSCKKDKIENKISTKDSLAAISAINPQIVQLKSYIGGNPDTLYRMSYSIAQQYRNIHNWKEYHKFIKYGLNVYINSDMANKVRDRIPSLEKEAIGILDSTAKHETQALLYYLQGIISYNMEADYTNALVYGKKGLALQPSTDMKSNLNRLLAMTYPRLGDWVQGVAYLKDNIRLFKQAPLGRYFLVDEYSNLGLLYHQIGKEDSAIAYFRKDMMLRNQLDKDSFETRHGMPLDFSYEHVYFNMADAFYGLAIQHTHFIDSANINAAKKYQKQSSLLIEKSGNASGLSQDSYFLLGKIQLLNKEYEAALKNFEKSYKERKENLGNHPMLAEDLAYKGEVFYAKNRLDSAMYYFHLSLAELDTTYKNVPIDKGINVSNIRKKGTNTYALLGLKGKIKTFYRLIYDTPAEKQADLAQKLFRIDNFGIEKLQNGFISHTDSLNNLVTLKPMLLKVILAQMDSLSKLKILENAAIEQTDGKILQIYQYAQTVALDMYKLTKDKSYFDKALNYADNCKARTLKKQIKQTTETTPNTDFNAAWKTFIGKNDLIQKLAEDGDNNTQKIIKISQERDSIEKSIKMKYPTYYQKIMGDEVLLVDSLQKHLSPQMALCVFSETPTHCIAFILTNKTQEVIPLPLTVDTLQQLVAVYNSEVAQNSDSVTALYYETSYRLYNKLISPLLPYLKDTKRWVIIPSNTLSSMPFEALTCEQWNRNEAKVPLYLIEKYAISYNRSLQSWAEIAKRPAAKATHSFLGIVPTYNGMALNQIHDKSDEINPTEISTKGEGAQSSLSLKKEVDTLQSIMGGEVLVGKNANKNALFKNIKSYQIQHFSMHGIATDYLLDEGGLFFCKPENQDLLDTLRFKEIMRLPQMDNTAIVTLSACQTGKGKYKEGEGTMDMSYAFLFAGARSCVKSFWNLADWDKFTPVVMARFYTALKEGNPKDIALQKAKIWAIHNKECQNPFYWATLSIEGDMQPLQPIPTHFTQYLIMLSVLFMFVLWFVYRKYKQ